MRLSSFILGTKTEVIRKPSLSSKHIFPVKNINDFHNLVIVGHKLLVNNLWSAQNDALSQIIETLVTDAILSNNNRNRKRIINYISDNYTVSTGSLSYKISIFEKRIISIYLLKLASLLKDNSVDLTILRNEIMNMPSIFTRLLPNEYIVAFSEYFASYPNLADINKIIQNHRLKSITIANISKNQAAI